MTTLGLRSAAIACLVACVSGAALFAQEAAPPPQSKDEAAQEILKSVQGYGTILKFQALPASGDRYVVKSGDSLSVDFTLTTQYNESVIVRPDGYIGLIGAPDVHVAGETEPEITETVRKAYAGILADPLLTVTVKNFESPYFVVGGEVKNPGKFVLHGDTTLAQSIAIAGGFNGTTAKDSDALLVRRVSSDYVEVRKIDLKAIDSGDISEDVRLKSGDMVFIPKNRLSKVQPFLTYFLAYRLFNINFVQSSRGSIGH
jgi:protein involved in polysaccharide export with SLBB domain